MILFPAIDIRNGQCVRLTRGVFSTAEKVAEDWLDTALNFKKEGAEWVHMVDLDGALSGKPENSPIFITIAKDAPLKVQLGGGIRSMENIAYYIEHGISRVILGSIAIQNPNLVKEAVREYGNRIAVGIDAKKSMVKSSGWLTENRIHYIEMAKHMESLGVETIIYTDISRDGTLEGPNLKQLQAINNAVTTNIIASGGIRNLEDIKVLKEMELYGAICGKSIYKGTLSLKEAINCCIEEMNENGN
ncbi:MAG: 1-(5-phosphoribosyl)-5-[(5-phosphoribosylamino)methylideneamino]imidazole-4-carboxamide isomerase [Eubacteriales bacterium]|nr:1-(5-phosphoribosyl)-5-[(5-phosphoribosylamino)methylideneamino]imidazole-4-carboxamide isomerase [Eubacteriales bacterium]